MSLKTGIDAAKARVEEQLQFIEWLKTHDLYNPMEPAHVMNRMHEVWVAANKETSSPSFLWSKLKQKIKNFKPY